MRKSFYLILVLIIFYFSGLVFAFGLKIDTSLSFRQEEDGIHRYLKVSQTIPRSYLAIYSVENPEHPEPEYVYGIEIGDKGETEIDFAALTAGKFVIVNTFEPGACNALSLEDCRNDPNYLGEFSFEMNEEQMINELRLPNELKEENLSNELKEENL